MSNVDSPVPAVPPAVSVVIPCYDEAPSVLQQTVDSMRSSLGARTGQTFEIIVVDDGSVHHSYEEVVHVDRLIRHKVNHGYGGALKTGIRHATHPWIAITDADGTYPVEVFGKLLDGIPEHDMVIGARQWASIAALRRLPKRILTKLASLIAGEKIDDLNSGMRVFHRDLYENHHRIYPEGFSFSSTLTMVGLTNYYDVDFAPIRYLKREGTSKIRPIKDTIRFFTQLLRLSLYFRPLRFFVPLSGVLVVLAIARGIRDVLVADQFGGLTLVLFFMSFQVFFFGLIAEIINKKQ